MLKRRSFLALLLTATLGLATALSPSPASYYPHAIGDFDGTNDYLTRGAGLTGAADGKLYLFSAWVRIDGGDGNWGAVSSNSGDRCYLMMTAADKFEFGRRNSSSAVILQHLTITTYTAGSSWYHVLSSGDLGNSKAYIYINDVSRGDTPVVLTDDDIDATVANWSVGAQVTGGAPFNGAIAELYFALEYLDISVEANRRLFIDANGYPVDLGIDGSRPTGTAPIIYMRERANNAGLNFGTGGDFTVNGAPLFTEGPVPFFPLSTWTPGRGRSSGMRIH